MTDAPLVSTVLIFYNEERFLAEAVQSALAQTFESWELLLVDDGSKDGSSELARGYARRHPDRIRYLEHPGHANLGMSATRNLGINSARGMYLSFLDADDVWLPRKLEQQVALIQANPRAAMVVGLTQWWYGWTGVIADSNRDFVQTLPVPLDTVVAPPAILTAFLKDEYASIADILVTREAAQAVGGYESTFRGLYEDQAFHAKICAAYPVYLSHQTWYRYRQHPDSCVAAADVAGEKPAARRRYLTWLDAYLQKAGVTDRELLKALSNELLPYRSPGLARVRNMWRGAALGGKRLVPRLLSPKLRHAAARWRQNRIWPPVGFVRMGHLRRLTPFSRDWGFSRGRPVDRYYIESFLERPSADVRGRALEIADATYIRRFGGDRVTAIDVLHSPVGDPGPEVTILDDLTTGESIPSNAFDCIILTQTLLLVYDVRAVIRTVQRILRPGGVALVTVPGITPYNHSETDTWGQYWSFTSRSIVALFAEFFPREGLTVSTYGNVLTSSAFLYSMSAEDLTREELDAHDPDFELIICLRVQKPA